MLSVSTSNNKIVTTKDRGAELTVHQGLFPVEEGLNARGWLLRPKLNVNERTG